MAKKHGPNKENLDATRRHFLKIARNEFSTRGYYDASTANIVDISGMARGSLYYHFGDKKGLFRAVYEELMVEMQNAVREAISNKETSWDSLITGCLTVLDLCMDSKTRRIIIDVHTALSYQERLEVLNTTLLFELMTILKLVKQDGYFQQYNESSLGLMIFGIISESSRSFELAADIEATRQAAGTTFVMLMEKARA